MSQKQGSVFQFGTGKPEGGRGDAPREGGARPALRTVLGAGCSVEGKLVCTGPTRLDGTVTGELVADEFLLIDRHATVTADLNVSELVVRGRVKGNIVAKTRVTLEDSAQVEGDIETPAISINDGAQVVGKVDVIRRAAPAKPDTGDMATDAIIKRFAPVKREAGEAASA